MGSLMLEQCDARGDRGRVGGRPDIAGTSPVLGCSRVDSTGAAPMVLRRSSWLPCSSDVVRAAWYAGG